MLPFACGAMRVGTYVSRVLPRLPGLQGARSLMNPLAHHNRITICLQSFFPERREGESKRKLTRLWRREREEEKDSSGVELSG